MTQQPCVAPDLAAGAEMRSPARRDLVDDDISRQLIHILQRILGIESISADQDFFDLGGDSSLAVQMFAQIEDVFKIRLPLATLYEAPTVAELASILRSKVSDSRWSPLVVIQPNGSRPPFFCVHPHGGNVLVYRDLSRHLGSDQPFFGLQSPGLDGGQEPLTRIEDMAALYVMEIRKVQPRGPYFLGGYCMGGAVAYEAACQLRAAGEEVALLALFDAMEFSTLPPPSFLQMSYYHCQRFLFHLANLLQVDPRHRSGFLSEKIRSLRVRIPVWLSRLTGRSRGNSPGSAAPEAQVLDRIWRANSQAFLDYVAKPYPGTVTDIRPCRQYRLFDRPQFKWDRLAQGGQRTIVLPVNPPAMLHDPFVRHLAVVLRECLDNAIETADLSSTMPLTSAVSLEGVAVAKPCQHPDCREVGKRVFEIDPLRDPRWKAFIDRRPDASVFHRVEWLQALKSCYGYVPLALSSSPPGDPLANGLLLCEVRSPLTGNRFVSLPFSDHCEPLVNHPEEVDQFVANLAERVDKGRWKYFEIRPIICAPGSQTLLGVSNTYYFHRLDLRQSEQLLLKSFHKDSVQRKIRRAERESLRYEVGSSEILLKHFYKLLIMTRRRQGLPPQPLKWFRSLIAFMGEDVKIRVALKGEAPVASILTISHKKTIVYKYGCSDARFNNLGGTAMLFWNAIKEAKANGIEELDMGRSDTDNPGLVTFKEHWGAQRSTVNYWRYPAQAAAMSPEGAIKHAKELISVAPDISLVMLGNLLYRHIG